MQVFITNFTVRCKPKPVRFTNFMQAVRYHNKRDRSLLGADIVKIEMPGEPSPSVFVPVCKNGNLLLRRHREMFGINKIQDLIGNAPRDYDIT